MIVDSYGSLPCLVWDNLFSSSFILLICFYISASNRFIWTNASSLKSSGLSKPMTIGAVSLVDVNDASGLVRGYGDASIFVRRVLY